MASGFSADGTLLAVGGSNEHATIEVWELGTYRRRAVLEGHTSSVLQLAVAPDKKTIASGGLRDGLRVWDVASRRQRFARFQDKETRIVGVAFVGGGRYVAALAHGAGAAVRFWETATGRECPFPLPAGPGVP